MSASSKKSPLTTTKKKKATPVPGKSKKNGTAKKDKGKDLVNNKDGSYLDDESQSILVSVGSPPHTVATSSSSIDHTVMKRLKRLERNNTISSTPVSSPQSGARDNVTFRLPQTKVRSPGTQKSGELTPHANLLNSYKWPAREEISASTPMHPQLQDSRNPGNHRSVVERGATWLRQGRGCPHSGKIEVNASHGVHGF